MDRAHNSGIYQTLKVVTKELSHQNLRRTLQLLDSTSRNTSRQLLVPLGVLLPLEHQARFSIARVREECPSLHTTLSVL